MEKSKQFVINWIKNNDRNLSDWHQIIWNYGETAFREYRSAKWYVDLLRKEGFQVEEGSGGMPTAFCATWSNGDGPIIGGYAEYDAIPDNCQAADTIERPRDGLSGQAGGHTDPHSMLGIASLGGFLAAKASMEKLGIKGELKFFGEPAEKLCASKPIHAAAGYYDDLDAAISFHPSSLPIICNTTIWDIHSCVGYAVMYTFRCDNPENWFTMSNNDDSAFPFYHLTARCPGATDAVIQMYVTSKMFKEHMLSTNSGWSVNETIINVGQATADNLPAPLGQIYYFIRTQEIEMAEMIVKILDNNAEAAAKASNCHWEKQWIAKSRPGLPNHILADVAYKNMEIAGPPIYGKEAIRKAQEIQKNLGFEPMERPFLDELEQLLPPLESDKELKKLMPSWQKYFISDDYTEYCWHAPTVRLYVSRAGLKSPAPGKMYPSWVANALGGIRECTDPTFVCASKTIGMTIIDLLTKPEILEAAKAEFMERTGGGIGGSKWLPCLCDYEPAIDFRWPEYITTVRGENKWVIPAEGDK